MSESKKLNRLSLNKETITDLDVPPGRDVVGGEPGPLFTQQQGCPPTVTKSPKTCIVQLPRVPKTTGILCV